MDVLFCSPYIFLLLLVFFFFFYHYNKRSRRRNRSPVPTNWPVVGMLPALIWNAHRIHDFITEVLKETEGSFEFKGPRFANMDMLVTSDPSNVHHILSKNFSNYPKGPEFKKIFDILGDGIFNVDSVLWELHRKTTLSLFNHPKFHDLLHRTLWRKVENGLFPLLDEVVKKQGSQVDLQELFQRFMFDNISTLILDYDPQTLSLGLPFVACEKAFTETEEALLYRHILPESLWKLLKWLQIGTEKKLSENWKAFDQFLFHHISVKLKEVNKESAMENQKKNDICFVKAFTEDGFPAKSDIFLRDTFLNLMVAGRDTTSATLAWFFYLLSKNPSVETKILEEIRNKLHKNDESVSWRHFKIEELNELVYLHGALCEALRLFPPVSLEHKAPVQPDILPSGHCVNPKTKIILSIYSMGRMETIWGEDCLMFKPDRWITERGKIKHEPSYKFPAFNAGPRTCLGKEMAFIQMKIVAANIIENYHLHLVDGHPISTSDSIILQMKYGLKVTVSQKKSSEEHE